MSAAIDLISQSPEQTQQIAATIGGVVRAGDVIALVGELGAGKTQFVRGLAEGMDVDTRLVSSPTFVLVQEYQARAADRPVLVHIDAYRLHGEEDLASIGWDDDAAELRQGAVLAVEWADRVTAALPADRLDVTLRHAGGARWMRLQPHGSWGPRIEVIEEVLAEFRSGELQDE